MLIILAQDRRSHLVKLEALVRSTPTFLLPVVSGIMPPDIRRNKQCLALSRHRAEADDLLARATQHRDSNIVISSRLLSIHLSLGRLLLLFPGTTMSIVFLDRLSSSLLLICPYKCNRFCLRNVDIWHNLASSFMIRFLTWSFLVLPLIHRSIIISATCNLFSSFSLTAQRSAPYVIVGLITVLYTLSFSLVGTSLSHSTPVSCFHFIQASLPGC